ncbi:MAG: RidA family protein [Anaerolineaceae bacterium]|nr:RidA family protein [Anaerolineaceae bacterium]
MKKQAVTVANGPSAIGPYSVGVQAGEFVFTAGQIGLDPTTGNIVAGGVEAETRQALENLKKILEAAHSGLEQVVKTTVFLQNMGDFAAMNAIYAHYFTEPYPARSAIQVAALPKNAQVEIEAVAITH